VTDPVTIAVAAVALALSLAIGVLHAPRWPALDGERWFKLWLATLIRGRAEAEGLDAEAWAARVVRFVPYHPAGRLPERKILRPEAPPPTPALEGEVALQEALAARPDAASRWALLYDEDERGLVARLADPSELGPEHDPAVRIRGDVDWEAVAVSARGEGPLDEALAGASTATWVLLPGGPEGAPDLLGALAAVLGERAEWHRTDDPPPATGPIPESLEGDIAGRRGGDVAFARRVMNLLATLDALAPAYEDRLVIVASGAAVHLVLEALRASAPLRDRIEAVVSVHGIVGGLDGIEGPLAWTRATPWLDAHFRHDALDLEAGHRVPFFALQWLDRDHAPPGALGIPLERARFPEPTDPDSRRPAVEPVDLGPLPLDPDLPLDLVARALRGVVTAWGTAR
jgi:hypothetical protein